MKRTMILLIIIMVTFQLNTLSASPQDPLHKALSILGAPIEKLKDLTSAIHLASNQTKISPYLLASLCYTESNFNYKAVSKRGYSGLMQTPTASKKWADVDILHGARILQEKLKLTNNNLEQALALYKGGKSQAAKTQAKKTMVVYNQLLHLMKV